jgi:hypothetical protein
VRNEDHEEGQQRDGRVDKKRDNRNEEKGNEWIGEEISS